jgi:hypothetical protein
MLGHSKADVTRIYAERDQSLAATIALKTGRTKYPRRLPRNQSAVISAGAQIATVLYVLAAMILVNARSTNRAHSREQRKSRNDAIICSTASL